MSKTAAQVLKDATPQQRGELVKSLRAAVMAQQGLWDAQLSLSRALALPLRIKPTDESPTPELSDEQDAAMCGLLSEMAVGWAGVPLSTGDLETLIERVLKA